MSGTSGGRRRAADDDSPSGSFGRAATPPARPADLQPPAKETRGRRRAREDGERRPSESYDHGPQLTPIIKPLAEQAPATPTNEPPPLVPIFPNMRPESSPTSGAGRRARRAAEDDQPAAFTGDAPSGRRRAPDDAPGRDLGSRTGDFAPRTGDPGTRTGDPGPRTGDLGSRTGDLGSRTGDLGSRTGDLRSRTGDLGSRIGDLGSRTGDLGSRTGDLGSRTGDLGSRTGDLGSRTGDVGSRTGDLGGRRRAGGDEPGARNGNGFGADRSTSAFGGDRPTSAFGAEAGPANGRGGAYSGETTMFRRDEANGARRQRAPFDDEPRAFDEGPRRGFDDGIRRSFDDGPSRDNGAGRRAGFEAAAPATEAGRRDDSGVRRRPMDDSIPGHDPYDGPSTGRGRRGSGEYSGDYTSGGTRRALREPPGGRPSGPPGRPERLDRGRGRSGDGSERVVVDPTTGPRPHRWVAMISVIAALVALGVCGVGTWFIFKDEKNGPDSAKSSSTAGPPRHDISSRDADPKPLTEAEVFPNKNIVAVADEPPYVIMATKAAPDCKAAATGDLATLLANAGCTEVVRATMKSPNQVYLITAGVFNVSSEQAAAQAFDAIKPIVDGGKGRFAGMSVGAGTGTDALVRSPTQLGWNYKGHFITYCVIARVDGNNFGQGDPYPNQITYDIVETYLDNGIIENRTNPDPSSAASASVPASRAPS